MSTEIDNSQRRRNKHGKTKDKNVEKSEKKRKRNGAEEGEVKLASPAKKHRSSQLSGPPTPHFQSAIPSRTEQVSPFYKQTSSLYLPLPPISQKHALQGICAEHISPLILTYYPPFHGVIVSYLNARLSTDPHTKTPSAAYARAVDEYASSFIWLTADFLVFRPQKHSVIEGYVNLQSESTIGLLCLNFFNASIDRRRLPKEWRWKPGGTRGPWKRKLKATNDTRSDSDAMEVYNHDPDRQTLEDAEGFFQDQAGVKIEGMVRFRVKDVDTSKSIDRETGFVSIEGTMLSEDEERALQQQERMRTSKMESRQLDWQNEPPNAMTGAIANGYDAVMSSNNTPTLEHKARY